MAITLQHHELSSAYNVLFFALASTNSVTFSTATAVLTMIRPCHLRADAVTDWNAIASTTIVVNAGQPPPVSVLMAFAMVQGAVYDAVNAIDRGHWPLPRAAERESVGLDSGGCGGPRRSECSERSHRLNCRRCRGSMTTI